MALYQVEKTNSEQAEKTNYTFEDLDMEYIFALR